MICRLVYCPGILMKDLLNIDNIVQTVQWLNVQKKNTEQEQITDLSPPL